MNFVKKVPLDAKILGDEQKFYMKYDKTEDEETMLESTLNNGMVKEREDHGYKEYKDISCGFDNFCPGQTTTNANSQ